MFNLINNTAEENQEEKTELQDLKKKRDEYAVDIRKKKREEILLKKRNKNLDIDQKIAQDANNGHNLSNDPDLRVMVDQWVKSTFEMGQFLELVEAVNSNDKLKQHYGVIGLRKLLSNGDQGIPIQPVIDANMVPRLIQFMQNDEEPHLQMEAAWALTNIASGTSQQTQSIIDKGGINCFIKLLRSPRLQIAEQAIWAIGNIAGDSSTFRDMILKWGGLQPLLELVSNVSDRAIIKHGTWAISNLCRGKPLPDLKLVEPAIPTLCAIVQKDFEAEVLTDAAWALSYLSRVESKIDQVIATGIIPSLVKHLENPHLPLVIPCLRILGNIVTGNEIQTEKVLSIPEFLPRLFRLTSIKKKAVRREACWTVSNITAGTSSQIECIMSNPEYVSILMRLATSDLPEVQKEATWALSNATRNSNPIQVARMIEFGLLDCFISLLNSEEPRIIEVVLEGLNNILNWGAQAATQNQSYDNEFLVLLENKGGVKKIEDLQSHPNNEVYLKALKILENHFELETML